MVVKTSMLGTWVRRDVKYPRSMPVCVRWKSSFGQSFGSFLRGLTWQPLGYAGCRTGQRTTGVHPSRPSVMLCSALAVPLLAAPSISIAEVFLQEPINSRIAYGVGM